MLNNGLNIKQLIGLLCTHRHRDSAQFSAANNLLVNFSPLLRIAPAAGWLAGRRRAGGEWCAERLGLVSKQLSVVSEVWPDEFPQFLHFGYDGCFNGRTFYFDDSLKSPKTNNGNGWSLIYNSQG